MRVRAIVSPARRHAMSSILPRTYNRSHCSSCRTCEIDGRGPPGPPSKIYRLARPIRRLLRLRTSSPRRCLTYVPTTHTLDSELPDRLRLRLVDPHFSWPDPCYLIGCE